MSEYILKVALGSGLIGVACGLVGVFAVIRRESLVGDAVSHASLPGIALSFLILGHKSPIGLLIGAVISGMLALLVIIGSHQYTKIHFDSSLALILSSFFGFGMVLLGIIQKLPNANQAGLEKYIFGQAATFLKSDFQTIFTINLIVIGLLILCYKELKVFTFDADYASSIGFSQTKLRLLLSFLLVLTIMGGLQIVGLILMSSLIICPATCARLWSDHLPVNLLISSVIGFLSGLLGTILSVKYYLPTGPIITLLAVSCVIVSIFISPKYGLIAQKYRLHTLRKRFEEQHEHLL